MSQQAMVADLDMTDTRLVNSARGGSREAFEALVGRYENRVFRLLRMRTNSVEDAEDLLQDVFLRSWTRLHQFDVRRPFSPWLYTLAVRLAVSRGRKQRLATATGRELDELTSEDNPAEIADRLEQNRNLWDLALAVLGTEPRTVLWLFYAESLSSLQIGEILGKSEAAVRAMLFRARNRLATHLESALP